MACTSVTLNGIALDCGNVGGLRTLYLADVLDVTGVTVASGTVTAVAMSGVKKFKAFSFRKGNANFVSTGNRNDQNGTNFVTTVTTVNFNYMETAKRTEMQSLSSANTYVIAKDENGKNWFIGYLSYNAGSVTANSGALMGDANNYKLTLTCNSAELPYELSDAVLTGII
jgi:hypothetical protein